MGFGTYLCVICIELIAAAKTNEVFKFCKKKYYDILKSILKKKTIKHIAKFCSNRLAYKLKFINL